MKYILSILYIFLTITACNYKTDKQILLDGNWEYKNGFDKNWLQGDSKGWKQKKYPLKFYRDKQFKNYKGYLTLRKKIPESFNAIVKESKAITFYSNYVADVSYFYINQTRIGQQGNVNPYKTGEYLQLITDIKTSSFRKGINYLNIVLYSDGIHRLGVEGGQIRIGNSEYVHKYLTVELLINVFFLVFYLAVGLYHLLLAIRKPDEKYNLFFGLFCIVVTFYWMFKNHYRDLMFPDPDIRMILEFLSLFLCGPLLISFLSSFFEKRLTLLTKIYYGVTLFLIPFVLFGAYSIKRKALLGYQLTILISLGYTFYLIIKHVLKKNRDAYYLLLGTLVFIFSLFNDLFESMGIINSVYISRYGFFLFITGIAGTLANKFVRVQNEVEELNEELEVKVANRTMELQDSLNSIQVLKTQQDGDYFLTSLLLEPLSGIYSKSDTVKVEMFLNQKKKFKFKNWQAEIGGDLITTYNLNLQNKEFVAILNGDAMGKSIQGAGGALVLGTVFKSVITRTKLSSILNSKSPERWIKDCYLELQLIFESFDGSMLVSSIISLVDCESGVMYFINTEHPWIVLYRDGQARFIEEQHPIRKIGLSGYNAEEQLQIEIFQFENDDIIFFGSDGRDDILIGEPGREGAINEDEFEFIRSINETNGDLKLLPATITKLGSWTDDCSIVKIEFVRTLKVITDIDLLDEIDIEISVIKSNFKKGEKNKTNANRVIKKIKSALRADPRGFRLLYSYANILLLFGKDKEAAKLYERCFSLNQSNSSLLYLLSGIYSRLKKYQLSIEYGERLRLRERRNIKNLKHLAKNYELTGNYFRSKFLMDEAVFFEKVNH